MAKFKDAIFDWAGTTVDFGSFAPMGAFIKAMVQFGIDLTINEARAQMVAAKWNHMHALLQMREYPNNELQKPGTPRLAQILMRSLRFSIRLTKPWRLNILI